MLKFVFKLKTILTEMLHLVKVYPLLNDTGDARSY